MNTDGLYIRVIFSYMKSIQGLHLTQQIVCKTQRHLVHIFVGISNGNIVVILGTVIPVVVIAVVIGIVVTVFILIRRCNRPNRQRYR